MDSGVIGVIGSVVSFFAGGALTVTLATIQNRQTAATRREEREWDAHQQRVQRDEKRSADEIELLRGLYQKAALVGMEYREIEEGGHDATESAAKWNKFSPRFREVKSELLLRGSPEIAQEFVEYVNHVQVSEAELDHLGYQRGQDGWEHQDAKLEQLMALMRADIERRMQAADERAADERAKLVARASTKVLESASAAKALTPGRPNPPT
jgi:hypothetical protein